MALLTDAAIVESLGASVDLLATDGDGGGSSDDLTRIASYEATASFDELVRMM